MKIKYYAAAGQWKHGLAGQLGIKMFQYFPESGEMKLIENVQKDITPGQILVNEKKGIIYAVDEVGSNPADPGGSTIYSFRIEPETGKLLPLNKKRTLGAYPCYISLDAGGEYLLVSHNGDHEHVTKIIKNEKGEFSSETVYDDAALVLYRVNRDGSLGDICDVSIPSNGGMQNSRAEILAEGSGINACVGVMSHLHSVTCNADSSLFAACDMGMGMIYTYHIDRKKGKIIQINSCYVDVGLQVRYSVFHPTKPYLYVNCEKRPYILVFSYNADTGELEEINRIKTVLDDMDTSTGGNDLVIHPDGKYLYCSNISNSISVMEIAEDGKLRLKQCVYCGGDRPRAICLSPDKRFLLCGNNRSATITLFQVHLDGTLEQTEKVTEDVLPSAIKVFGIEAETIKNNGR